MIQSRQFNMETVEEEPMHDGLPIDYPSDAVARYCEERAVAIRQLMVKTVRAVAAIGAHLAEVEGILPPGLFPRWAEHHFGWSQETTRRYKLLARAVDDNPRILELRSIELAIRFPALPERTQQAIFEAEAFRLRDAEAIIRQHKVEDWWEMFEGLMETDPGRAYHEIGLARDDPDLRDAADEALDSHAETFAFLSGRGASEIQVEAGRTIEQRHPGAASGRVTAQLFEEADGARLVIWVGEPVTIAIFPRVSGPAVLAWQDKVIRLVVEATNAATADRFGDVL